MRLVVICNCRRERRDGVRCHGRLSHISVPSCRACPALLTKELEANRMVFRDSDWEARTARLRHGFDHWT